MAPKLEQAGYRDEWMAYLEQGIRQSRHLGDLEAEAELHLQLGVLDELRGNYEEASRHFEASAHGFETLNSPLNQARALNRLAYVARRQRQFEVAARWVEAALDLLEEQEAERAYSYLVLGAIALDQQHWPEAADYFQKSLSLAERQNNGRMMARTLLGLGVAWRGLAKYQEAITSYQRAMALFAEIQDPIHHSVAQMNLGNVYLALEQPSEALKCYLPAERIFRQAQDRLSLAQINHNIGLVYSQLQQWEQAKEVYLLSISQQREVGNVALLVDTLNELGLLYLARGQLAKAIATFKEALNQLAKIEHEPGYESLCQLIATNLHRADPKGTLRDTL
jgi:tetratricopeptide (TPR) repeat protein